MKKLMLCVILLVLLFKSYSQDFVQRQGKKLKYKGDDIYLRGMAFGNLVWDPSLSPVKHHDEGDYRRLESLGMNVIRFYLSYKTFEDDAVPFEYKQTGWDWIDQNIIWAKAHHIFLILNLHVPQGGYQSQCKGDTLWNDPIKQKRVAALWKAIASRYKDEAQIAGYDILNEPTPSGSVEKWSALARDIIDSIRSVDKQHLIITERAIALNCDYGYSDENNNYPQITEENLMYTVHLYDPYEFTHQNLEWAGTVDGGKYPDENKITPPADATYATGNYSNPSISRASTDWRPYQGRAYKVNSDTLILGRVVFTAGRLGAGKVYYDDFELKELDSAGNELRIVFPISSPVGPFWWYSANNTGTYAEDTSRHTDSHSVSITGNTAEATVICPAFTFAVKKGHSYVVSGWMKGENLPVGATASITTEFYHSPSRMKPGVRNYDFLKDRITAYAAYIEQKGFPVYFGEFGTARNTFENDKGGARWVADAMQIFDSLGYHFTYHSYKESSFGYYDGWAGPVDTTTVNNQLETVFQNFFHKEASGFIYPVESTADLHIYPNPAQDLLYLENTIMAGEIEVYDLTGNLVTVFSGSPADISSLPKGSYLVKVRFSKGTAWKKLIKN